MRSSVWLTPVLLLGACVSTNAAVLDASVKLSPICDRGVIVYLNAGEVGKDYKEIALLNSKGESGYTTEAGMVHSQQQKAAKLGANGIILNPISEPKPGTKIIGAVLGTGTERKGSALAIWVPADSEKSAEICHPSKRS